jgi:type IV pilus assembly protein PilM
MAKKIGTIDFDGRTIRVLIARGTEVLHWSSTTVSGELMNQGLIGQPQAMAEQIPGLLGPDGAPRRSFVTSLTAHRATSKVLTLPKVKPKYLEEAVRRRAKQEMPLPMQETYLSWQVIGEQNGQLQVYAFAVPRNIIDRQVETLKAAGLKPRAMDLKPLALARVVNDPNCIVANLEDQGLGVVLVANGTPEILRSVPQTAEEAGPRERVEKLSQELNRTIQFYEEAHRGSPLPADTRVYATGLLLESQEIRELLAQRTPYPVELPKPPLNLPEDFPIASFSANLGLAMKDL